jgi:uncharacterized membrane protein
MTTTIKILVTIGILLACSLLTMAMNGGESSSKAPMFLVLGAVAGITAVWKYKPEPKKDNSSSDSKELDKR